MKSTRLRTPWGDVATAISYVLAGAGFTVLLGGGWWDVGLAGLFSLVVSLMVLNAGRFGPLTGEWLPLTAAFVAGVLTAIARCFLPDINGVLVILSAVLILVPGYGITVGVVELVSQHVLCGFTNLITGLIYLFKQVAGAYLGVKAVGLLVSFPAATQAVANLGNFLGTVLTVLFANVWARETGRPTSIVLLPAFVLLVSGSIGFRGLAALSDGDIHTGQEQFMQMFVVGFTLAAGLFVGNTIIRPLRTL